MQLSRAIRCGRRLALAWGSLCLLVNAHSAPAAPYTAPFVDSGVLQHVDFADAQIILPELTARFAACDAQPAPGCQVDPSRNTAILRFPDGTIFYDAKMAIDADGSTLSKLAIRPNQPETAFRYPVSDLSLDSERVPYIVLPIGPLLRTEGLRTGDLAAVVQDGRLQFAIVGDVGPPPKIGEGSMKLHANLGHDTCTVYDSGRNCSQFVDVSIDPPVLYFVFPHTRQLLYDGLSPANINARIAIEGRAVWTRFLQQQHRIEN